MPTTTTRGTELVTAFANVVPERMAVYVGTVAVGIRVAAASALDVADPDVAADEDFAVDAADVLDNGDLAGVGFAVDAPRAGNEDLAGVGFTAGIN